MYTQKVEEFFTKQQAMFKGLKNPTYPRYDISTEEKDGESVTTIEMACAGFDKEAFKVDADENMLYISGTPLEKALKGSKEYLVKNLTDKGFRFGFPTFLLGEMKDVKCDYEDGILKVIISKKKEDKVAISWG